MSSNNFPLRIKELADEIYNGITEYDLQGEDLYDYIYETIGDVWNEAHSYGYSVGQTEGMNYARAFNDWRKSAD